LSISAVASSVPIAAAAVAAAAADDEAWTVATDELLASRLTAIVEAEPPNGQQKKTAYP